MSNFIARNITRLTRSGLKMYSSGSTPFRPTTSQSSSPQILVVTCSADVGNNVATTASLSGYFIIPILSSSAAKGEVNINVFYVTSSIYDIQSTEEGDLLITGSATGSATYFNPISTEVPEVTNYNIPVRILRNETAPNVAIKTYHTLTGSNALHQYISSSISASTIRIQNRISGSIGNVPIISASGFSFNYIQSGSFGDGSTYNYRPGGGHISENSASFAILRDSSNPDDVKFQRKVSTSVKSLLFFSGSGKIGIGTDKPETDVEIRTDSFQVQRLAERRGIKVNPEGNIESFDKNATTATTGSEYILKYSRGVAITETMMEAIAAAKLGLTTVSDIRLSGAETVFNNLSNDSQLLILEKAEENGFINPPQVGDILGQIRWIAESGSIGDFDQRGTGETVAIKAVVNDVDSTGISSDLEFHVAPNKATGSLVVFTLDGGLNHVMTGSMLLTGNVSASTIIGTVDGGSF